MKGRIPVALHLLALLVAAVCAYLVFNQGRDRTDKAGKTILDAKPARLKSMAYDTGRKTVKVTPRQGGGYTLDITEQIRKPAKKIEPAPALKSPDGGIADGAAAKKELKKPAPLITETKRTSYRASKEFDKTLDRLLPLVATRDLGQIDQEKIEKFGLNKAERSFEVEVSGQKVRYTVGNQAYGGATTYLRQEPDGPVFLVSSGLLRSLDIRSPRYLERRLVGLDKKEVEKIQVSILTKSRVLKQLPGKPRKWVADDSPDSKNDLFDNWVNNFFRMGAQKYLGPDKLPPLSNVASLQILKGGRPVDTVELASAEGQDGKKDYYARSQHTGQWVMLRRADADGVVSDLPTVLEQ